MSSFECGVTPTAAGAPHSGSARPSCAPARAPRPRLNRTAIYCGKPECRESHTAQEAAIARPSAVLNACGKNPGGCGRAAVARVGGTCGDLDRYWSSPPDRLARSDVRGVCALRTRPPGNRPNDGAPKCQVHTGTGGCAPPAPRAGAAEPPAPAVRRTSLVRLRLRRAPARTPESHGPSCADSRRSPGTPRPPAPTTAPSPRRSPRAP